MPFSKRSRPPASIQVRSTGFSVWALRQPYLRFSEVRESQPTESLVQIQLQLLGLLRYRWFPLPFRMSAYKSRLRCFP